MSLEQWLHVKIRCECNPEALAVLAARQKEGFLDAAELTTDIRSLDAAVLRAAGVRGLIGGWPCQGNSVAGHQLGMKDSRTGLFGEVCRLAEQANLDFLLLENVAGLLGQNMLQDLRRTRMLG